MLTRTLKALTVATAIGAATITTANAQWVNAPTTYQFEVDAQIGAVIAAGRNVGFNYVVANQRGQMYTGGGNSYFDVHLQAGVDYRFESRCDRDCSDLDMSLRDDAGRELIADRLLNDVPGFTFRPSYTGVHRVVLELYRCNAYRCQVGAIVLAQG